MNKELIKKTKLTGAELKELEEKTRDLDKKQSHYLAYRTMMNEIRRELLRFIGCEIRTMEEIKNQFNIDLDQLQYHLSMLEQCYYIINSIEGWKSTPLAIGFLENTKMGDF